ncbi:metal/formaldehyde-sensitive transcriptional repressor [Ancylobacter polymorphus]|uniref:DNA-binding FrmR family transcriptional regulator n=1 Tax=Ancylobacter polymorphus TaxID=223390 RepID=A0ABU0BH34_9HYPH|nr:metal/formaldehyde-sensitive transcriptional repressor [Ancylobacter polymorphus]MDQ0305130.1 DNA-binding FrmR family transcriptional regulator [Ancylobacter polymorphus]
MPHSPDDKKRALTRLRRIKGQAEALERAIEAEAECGVLLQQIAALRGAAGGLMAEVLDIHLRESIGHAIGAAGAAPASDELDAIMKILRTYLK